MNIVEVTGLEQIFLGLYLMAHGGIHLIFLIYNLDDKTGVYTGWSGRSWLLDKALNEKITNYIGKITWILIMVLFAISGLGVLDLLAIDDFISPLIIFVSIIATLAFIAFYDGLSPTPLHWILGVVIDLGLIVFLIVFPNDVLFLIIFLVVIWLWGMFFHTKIIPQTTES
jgi:hypothetical protein